MQQTSWRQAIQTVLALLPKGEANGYGKWQTGIAAELKFWKRWLAKRGGQWADDYAFRLDPNTALQQHVIDVLTPPIHQPLRLLDVGAGPATYLGKRWGEYVLEITAIDPLAEQYHALFCKYGVKPPVPTQTGYAERLVEQFGENCFDLVHARNCIDHSYDPALAIEQMVAVAKPGGIVYMHHAVNEAEQQRYHGFHQWNLAAQDGDLCVSNRTQRINMHTRLAPVATVETQLLGEGVWMINIIRKHP